jgi:hypothetical protein
MSDRVALTGAEGGPIQFREMSDAELDTYIREQLIASGLAAQIDGAAGSGRCAEGAGEA